MSIDTALLIIIVLLSLILILVLMQARFTHAWMRGVEEQLADRLNKPNADLRDMMKKKQYTKIVSEITEERLSISHEPALYWYKGLALFHLENWEEARAIIERAIELNPSYEVDLLPYLRRMQKLDSNNA